MPAASCFNRRYGNTDPLDVPRWCSDERTLLTANEATVVRLAGNGLTAAASVADLAQ